MATNAVNNRTIGITETAKDGPHCLILVIYVIVTDWILYLLRAKLLISDENSENITFF